MNTLTNRAIAFCWAVDPLAFSVSAPPQFPLVAVESDVDFSAVSEFLSLPHPDNTRAPAAIMLSVVPKPFSFTLSFRRFISGDDRSLILPGQPDRLICEQWRRSGSLIFNATNGGYGTVNSRDLTVEFWWNSDDQGVDRLNAHDG
jgi:hypothetical protein